MPQCMHGQPHCHDIISTKNVDQVHKLYLFCSGELLAAIEQSFGSFDNLKTEMTAKTVAIQGSGWGWLVSFIAMCVN